MLLFGYKSMLLYSNNQIFLKENISKNVNFIKNNIQ